MSANTPPVAEKDDKHVNEHLANERTYLAWVRTSISLMGLGVVIAKLKYVSGSNYAEVEGIVQAAHIGWLFAAVGVLTLFIALSFFMETQKQIREANYHSRKLLVVITSVLTGALGLTVLWYLTKPTKQVMSMPVDLSKQEIHIEPIKK